MQKNDGGAIDRAGFGVADVEDAGIDLLQWRERCVRAGFDRADAIGLGDRRPDRGKLSGGKAQDRVAQKTTAMMVDFV